MSAQENVSIRNANRSDVDAIVKLVESVYRGDSSKRGWTTEADVLDGQRTDRGMILEMMDIEGSVFFLGELNSRLVSSVFLQKKVDHAYLGMLAVDVNFQNLKLGRKLLTHCEEHARSDWGLNQIKITVLNVRNELMAWYERFGYSKTSEVYDFPDDPRYGIAKVKDLKLIEFSKIF